MDKALRLNIRVFFATISFAKNQSGFHLHLTERQQDSYFLSDRSRANLHRPVNANFLVENCLNLKGSDHAVHEELVAGHLGVVKGEEWHMHVQSPPQLPGGGI